MLQIINTTPIPTRETLLLKEALEKLGVEVKIEALAEASKIKEQHLRVHIS